MTEYLPFFLHSTSIITGFIAHPNFDKADADVEKVPQVAFCWEDSLNSLLTDLDVCFGERSLDFRCGTM